MLPLFAERLLKADNTAAAVNRLCARLKSFIKSLQYISHMTLTHKFKHKKSKHTMMKHKFTNRGHRNSNSNLRQFV